MNGYDRDEFLRQHAASEAALKRMEDTRVALPVNAMALAEAQAARDRDTLAHLLREGQVRRGPEVRSGSRQRDIAFTQDITRRSLGRAAVNLAIKPKRKKR